jgi:(R,R)-butanediol dehydrogenase/meso-butanediol dehydrogenase/diacetyl reductase
MPAPSSTMHAAVYRGDGAVPVESIPTPTLDSPHDVLVEIAFCGICGTDLHIIVEDMSRNGWGGPGFIGGHEWSGRVVAVGDEVTRWKIGDHVTAASLNCGTCHSCLAGRPAICRVRQPDDGQGGWSQYLRRHENGLEAVPDGLDLRAAALTEPLAVSLHAVTRSGAKPGDRVLVTGAGPIGTLSVVALHVRGIDDVTVSEPNPLRRAIAGRLGAAVLAPEDLSPASAGGPDTRFDAVIETSGSSQAVSTAVDCLVPGGTLVLVGVVGHPGIIDPIRILTEELVVTGSALYDDGGIAESLRILASGQVPVDILVEPTDIGLQDVEKACAQLGGGQLAGKVMVVPS